MHRRSADMESTHVPRGPDLADRGNSTARPRSSLVHTASHGPLDLVLQPQPVSNSPPLPARSPLRPPPRSRTASKEVPATIQDMPTPILRMSSSASFSIDALFLSDKPKAPPLLALPRTPSPDKPLPITPLSAASPSSLDGSTLDSPSRRDLIDSPPPSATLPPRGPTTALSKRTHALLELIDSERAYASDLALLRNVHLPVALGTRIIFTFSS